MLENLTRRFTDIFAGLRGRKISERNVRDTVREIRRALLEADVALPVVREFETRVIEAAIGTEVVEGVDSGQQFVKVVNDELAALMGPVDPEIEWRKKGPTVLLLAGLQGSGKTTTCAKLARFLATRKKRRPLMVAADIQRPAAIEQLKVLGRTLDIPVFHEPGLTPPQICARAVKEAPSMGCDTVLLDTAGRLHIDDALMSELKKIARKTAPEEIFLVCDAMTGQDAVNSAREFNEALELTGVILTKLDGDARGGAALSVKAITGKPIKFVGVGEKLDRLEEFHPDRMASRILGMGDVVGLVDRAQAELDQDEQQRMQEKILEATFNLEDFLGQLRQIKKLGSLRDLLGHLPGLGAQVDQLDLQGNEIEVVESIIQSMTRQERRRPEILNTSRRKRIAAGCGRALGDVNDLLKQFKVMKGMMDEMAGHGRGLLGKLKGARAVRRRMTGAPGHSHMQDWGGSAGGSPGVPGLAAPGEAPGRDGAKKRAKPSQKEIRKKRKQERQRRKKARRR
ncbi:MAG: signal recognition particle protein [Planctomycetota bacterium]